MNKIANSMATILMAIFFTLAVGYSIYTVFWGTADDAATIVNESNKKACEKAKARAVVFENFALEASAARRRSAETLSDLGRKVAAQNEIATAKKYEGFAKAWDELTTKDCDVAYPNP